MSQTVTLSTFITSGCVHGNVVAYSGGWRCTGCGTTWTLA